MCPDGRIAGLRGRFHYRGGGVTEHGDRAAKTPLQLAISAPEVSSQLAGQLAALSLGSESRRGAPCRLCHLVVNITQQVNSDRRPCPRVTDLGQTVQRLATRLGHRRFKFTQEKIHGLPAVVSRNRPGEHVPHIEIGLYRAPREEERELSVIGVNARGESGL